MTFEQWWGNTVNKPTPSLKPHFAACWNEAVEECRRWMAAPNERTEATDLMAKYASVDPLKVVRL
jgi:hypothetical protein